MEAGRGLASWIKTVGEHMPQLSSPSGRGVSLMELWDGDDPIVRFDDGECVFGWLVGAQGEHGAPTAERVV